MPLNFGPSVTLIAYSSAGPKTFPEDTLAYLIFAVVMATALIGYLSMRMKTPNDPAKSVDSFRRAIKALAPEADEDKDRKAS